MVPVARSMSRGSDASVRTIRTRERWAGIEDRSAAGASDPADENDMRQPEWNGR